MDQNPMGGGGSSDNTSGTPAPTGDTGGMGQGQMPSSTPDPVVPEPSAPESTPESTPTTPESQPDQNGGDTSGGQPPVV